MKNTLIYLTLFSVFVTALPTNSYAFWVWSKKTKKLSNPDSAPIAGPKRQFEYAKVLFDNKDYKRAQKEFRKIVKHYKDAVEAPEAQYYYGLSLKEQGKLIAAYQALQKVLDSYPYSKRINEVVDAEFEIAEAMFDRDKVKLLGLKIDPDTWTEHPSIEIYQKIVQNAPYSGKASHSQYRLAMLYKELKRYPEAIEAFNELIDKYPESTWFEPGKYQLALVSSTASLNAEYDQELSDDAQERFEKIVENHAGEDIGKKAKAELVELRTKEAAKYYKTAEFYINSSQDHGARVYLKQIIENFADTEYFALAEKALRKLEERNKS